MYFFLICLLYRIWNPKRTKIVHLWRKKRVQNVCPMGRLKVTGQAVKNRFWRLRWRKQQLKIDGSQNQNASVLHLQTFLKILFWTFWIFYLGWESNPLLDNIRTFWLDFFGQFALFFAIGSPIADFITLFKLLITWSMLLYHLPCILLTVQVIIDFSCIHSMFLFVLFIVQVIGSIIFGLRRRNKKMESSRIMINVQIFFFFILYFVQFIVHFLFISYLLLQY